MKRPIQPTITEETKFVTGKQIVDSARWPFGNDKFYKMVREGLIKVYRPYEGARPAHKVNEIGALFEK
jgi:hypothetical protein